MEGPIGAGSFRESVLAAIRFPAFTGQRGERLQPTPLSNAIGRAEYNRATTTLWRAAKRLEGRGLAKRAFYGKPGVLLTDEGLEVARGLSVTTVQR